MSYQKFKEERDKLLYNTKAKYLPSKTETDLTKIVEGIYDLNTFVTVFDMSKGEFIFQHNVKKLLGYGSSEFTISNLNNLGKQNNFITSNKDIEHKRRYDNVVYTLITNNNTFQVFGDYYELKFRIYKRITFFEKKEIWVKRRCYILSINDGVPNAQFDRWEIIDEAELKQAKPYYPVATVYSIHHQKEAAKLFYEENRKMLGMPTLSSNQKIAMKYLLEGKKTKDISHVTEVDINTVNTHIERAKKKYLRFFDDNYPNINTDKITLMELKNQLSRFGLYPYY